MNIPWGHYQNDPLTKWVGHGLVSVTFGNILGEVLEDENKVESSSFWLTSFYQPKHPTFTLETSPFSFLWKKVLGIDMQPTLFRRSCSRCHSKEAAVNQISKQETTLKAGCQDRLGELEIQTFAWLHSSRHHHSFSPQRRKSTMQQMSFKEVAENQILFLPHDSSSVTSLSEKLRPYQRQHARRQKRKSLRQHQRECCKFQKFEIWPVVTQWLFFSLQAAEFLFANRNYSLFLLSSCKQHHAIVHHGDLVEYSLFHQF